MENFDKTIWSEALTLVEFFATWCGECQMMDPTIERLERTRNGRVDIKRVDVDNEAMLPIVRRYAIKNLPTLMLFHRGESLWRREGRIAYEQIIEALDEAETIAHPRHQLHPDHP